MNTKNNFNPCDVGTGKSYVLRVLQDVLESQGLSEKIAFTAPTGVAACNVRGLTIHSWSGIGRGERTQHVSLNASRMQKRRMYAAWETCSRTLL